MSQKIRIKLKSYDHNLVDKSAEKIVKTVKSTGAVVSGPIPLPTHKKIYTVLRSPFVIRLVTHRHFNHATLLKVFMFEVILRIFLAVHRQSVDIDILIVVLRRRDQQILTVFEMQHGFREERRTNDILSRARSNRIES